MNYSKVLKKSTVGKFSGSWVLGDRTQVKKEKETFFFLSLKEFSPRIYAVITKQKARCMCKIVVLLIKPIAFSDVLVANSFLFTVRISENFHKGEYIALKWFL